mmetsp:Transcript_55983/g.121802  ORF Transcript_55983/g.121802 Transcript_55983/m.121802 type:complete len:88 (-) Transcript_55983:58-321(-)
MLNEAMNATVAATDALHRAQPSHTPGHNLTTPKPTAPLQCHVPLSCVYRRVSSSPRYHSLSLPLSLSLLFSLHTAPSPAPDVIHNMT